MLWVGLKYWCIVAIYGWLMVPNLYEYWAKLTFKIRLQFGNTLRNKYLICRDWQIGCRYIERKDWGAWKPEITIHYVEKK